MTTDNQSIWGLQLDINHGFLTSNSLAPRQGNPKIVDNVENRSMLRALREELLRCRQFSFSVAFVSPRAIALLKQELVDFKGKGRIFTSDYLGFNSPQAFSELLNLRRLGIEVRIHRAKGFHPKGYIFEHDNRVTAVIGSSNLTESALVTNHEWNLRVSAAYESDLGSQLQQLLERQVNDSDPLTGDWIRSYAETYVAASSQRNEAPRLTPVNVPDESTEEHAQVWTGSLTHAAPAPLRATLPDTLDESMYVGKPAGVVITPNVMQVDALREIQKVRDEGASRALVISATGTGKTMLSALDVLSQKPTRVLFLVHREQILDRTMREYSLVFANQQARFGKLSGNSKQGDRDFVFATIQTLSQPELLSTFDPAHFDYIVVDEAHRCGAPTHQRVIAHFTPKFLLGITATPERSDAFNVFDLFHYNVPYEIRLGHALEADMLTPFHYYGITDVTYDDGSTTSDLTSIGRLVSPERVQHILESLETYCHAGVAPRGLIFCSRTEEAHQLSELLNRATFHGRKLRTISLTGKDSVPYREECVEEFEAGKLDYILTVDVFNEGVDIPTVNQIVMLRQTQSAIVFVQQLGRGLRKAKNKEYVVVLDFIGNYQNNFMIPMALFGDESLNKESLRKNLIASEENGVLPGLSSVRFDRISHERILASIQQTNLESIQRLKAALQSMYNRLGRRPKLYDFHRFESVDPVLLATKRPSYPLLVESVLSLSHGLSQEEQDALALLSQEMFTAHRIHEFVLLEALLSGPKPREQLTVSLAEAGANGADELLQSTIDTFTLEHHAEADRNRYIRGIVEEYEGLVSLTKKFTESYQENNRFREEVDDLIQTGLALVRQRYDLSTPFTVGMQYSRKEVARILGWPRKWTSTIYGYRVDQEVNACPVFVTLHKSEEVSETTAYEDQLLDDSTMLWYTRSRRTLKSGEVVPIVSNTVAIYAFVKKDDADGTDFYYLGRATSHEAEQTTMASGEGQVVDVVRMKLAFDKPINRALYDYFHPTVTA